MNREEGINIIAYQIWEEEGGSVHGNDIQHWLKAEKIWQEQNKPSRTASQAGPSTGNQPVNTAVKTSPAAVFGTKPCGRVPFSKKKISQ